MGLENRIGYGIVISILALVITAIIPSGVTIILSAVLTTGIIVFISYSILKDGDYEKNKGDDYHLD